MSTDLGGATANLWWLLGVIISAGAGLATNSLITRRSSRSAPASAEPVATQTARDVLGEYRLLIVVPLQDENQKLRQRIEDLEAEHRARCDELERERTLAERAQASAERDLAAANAELNGLRPQFHKALRDLAEERRRPDDG